MLHWRRRSHLPPAPMCTSSHPVKYRTSASLKAETSLFSGASDKFWNYKGGASVSGLTVKRSIVSTRALSCQQCIENIQNSIVRVKCTMWVIVLHGHNLVVRHVWGMGSLVSLFDADKKQKVLDFPTQKHSMTGQESSHVLMVFVVGLFCGVVTLQSSCLTSPCLTTYSISTYQS